METSQCVNITELIDENKSLKAIIECLKLDIKHLNRQIADKYYACKTKSNLALVDEKWKCTGRQFKPSRIIDNTAATRKTHISNRFEVLQREEVEINQC